MKNAKIVIEFIEQLIELKRLIVEAKEDNHIRLMELAKLASQMKHVLKAVKRLQGVHLYDLSDAEIEQLVSFVMLHIDREVRFTHKDAVNALIGLVRFSNIGK